MYKQTFPAPRGHTKPAPYFVQGTTPVFSYTVTGDDGDPVSLSSAKKIEVTFSQGGTYSADERFMCLMIIFPSIRQLMDGQKFLIRSTLFPSGASKGGTYAAKR